VQLDKFLNKCKEEGIILAVGSKNPMCKTSTKWSASPPHQDQPKEFLHKRKKQR